MSDINMLTKARLEYSSTETPFLDELRSKVQQEKPWQGLKILHNVPLTMITVFKIEVLVLGGAEVTTTCTKVVPPEKKAFNLLQQANFRVQFEQVFNEEFDIHLDCCAELLSLAPPKLGAIELTQTGSETYKNSRPNYPLISVDDSKIKVLETYFGTGDGFCRALFEHVGDSMKNKPFVVFGYGKVGQGIVYALKKMTHDITVIDIDFDQALCLPGVKYVLSTNKPEIESAIKHSYCAITATGVKNVISDFYQLHKSDFGSSILTNMGADDEYGPHFSDTEVAFSKKPFNFSISTPTAFRYLDPVFYCHNLAIDLILSNQFQPGYHPYPDVLAQQILSKWQSIYDEQCNSTL